MPTEKVLDNVMVNFLADEEVAPEEVARLNEFKKTSQETKAELDTSDEYKALVKSLEEAEQVLKGAKKALAEYEKEIEARPDNMKIAEMRYFCGAAVLSGLAKKVTSIARAPSYEPPVDEKLEQLKKEKYDALERKIQAEIALEQFPVNVKLREVNGAIKTILLKLPQTADRAIKGLKEVHGITRERIGTVVGKIEKNLPINEAELTEEPSIYGEIRNYLERQGITDRLSYERVLFGYSGKNVANWYRNCGIRGLFPKNLVEIVIGQKLKNLTEADLVLAGDKLFGKVDKGPLIVEIRQIFANRGVISRSEVLGLDKKVISECAKESSAGSATILFRILAGNRPQLLGAPMNETLANILFPDNQTK